MSADTDSEEEKNQAGSANLISQSLKAADDNRKYDNHDKLGVQTDQEFLSQFTNRKLSFKKV